MCVYVHSMSPAAIQGSQVFLFEKDGSMFFATDLIRKNRQCNPSMYKKKTTKTVDNCTSQVQYPVLLLIMFSEQHYYRLCLCDIYITSELSEVPCSLIFQG